MIYERVMVRFYDGWDAVNHRRTERTFLSPAFPVGDSKGEYFATEEMLDKMKAEGFTPDPRDIIETRRVNEKVEI